MALFGKESNATPAAAGGSGTSPEPQQRSAGGPSYVGPNIVLDGTISGNEALVVEGTVKGKIDLRSDLRVAGHGRVEADVHARNIVVEGSLKGEVVAENRVELMKGSAVDGNIKAPKIVVAEGARFRGAVDMGSERPKE